VDNRKRVFAQQLQSGQVHFYNFPLKQFAIELGDYEEGSWCLGYWARSEGEEDDGLVIGFGTGMG
jgi:hypothetical protein